MAKSSRGWRNTFSDQPADRTTVSCSFIQPVGLTFASGFKNNSFLLFGKLSPAILDLSICVEILSLSLTVSIGEFLAASVL